MHEHIICENIINKAKSYGKVKKIVVECGQLAHLPAKDLKRTLKEHCKFDVVVKEIPAVIKCTECSFVGEPKVIEHAHDIAIFECPRCGKIPQILEGDKIVLKSVDVDE